MNDNTLTPPHPGGFCETCGHMALRHGEPGPETCKFPRSAPKQPCNCDGMTWQGRTWKIGVGEPELVPDPIVDYVPRGWNIFLNGSDVGVVFIVPETPGGPGPFLAHLHQDDAHTAVTGSGQTREQAVDAAFGRRAEFDQAILSVAEGIQGEDQG